MIAGIVDATLHARISVAVQDATGQLQQIDAVVDTGFNGFLTLPPGRVAALGLTWVGRQQVVLADGSSLMLNTYTATIQWEGRLRSIEVDESDSEPLVEMSLLERHTLAIEVVPGGSVTITAIP